MKNKDQRQLLKALRTTCYDAGAVQVEEIALKKHTAIDVTLANGKRFRHTLPNSTRGRVFINQIAQISQSIRALTTSGDPTFVHEIGVDKKVKQA